jgi:hypothetical protein
MPRCSTQLPSRAHQIASYTMMQLTKACDASITQDRVTWIKSPDNRRVIRLSQAPTCSHLTTLRRRRVLNRGQIDTKLKAGRTFGTCISNAAYAGLTECRGMQFVRRDYNNKMRQQAPAFVIFALLLMSIVCNHLCAMRGTQMGSVPIPPAALAERVQSRICEMIEEWQR